MKYNVPIYASEKNWHNTILENGVWCQSNQKIWHQKALARKDCVFEGAKSASFLVSRIYADQNHSATVRHALSKLVGSIGSGSIAVNIGAGNTRFHNVLNLEIADGPNVDIVGHGSELPFKDGSVDLVITQEVLEHVAGFMELVHEIHRVLKPGGIFFCQVPFQIGFHPGPSDFWRFTRQGLEHLFSPPGWQREELAISLGHGSGFYRISVEFAAVTISCIAQCLYRPAKGAFAVLFYPFKWFDLLTPLSAEKDRIPGGYYCIARKIGECKMLKR